MAAAANLKSMPIDELMKLRSQVDAALAAKVADERRQLEAGLAQLTRFGSGGTRALRVGARGKVAPKYRNPDNPSETYAGRGLKPRWLAAAFKSGKNLEHFAIAAPAKTASVKNSRRKARKAAKR
jgi:DNA-binding protein H-NS